MGSKQSKVVSSALIQNEKKVSLATGLHPTPSALSAAAPKEAGLKLTVASLTAAPWKTQVPMAARAGNASGASLLQQQSRQQKSFTMEEVQQLISANPDRTLVVIRDKVYDVTSFVPHHPGGESALRQNSGKDATDVFFSLHSAAAAAKLPSFFLGDLAKPKSASAAGDRTSAAALTPAPVRMADIQKAISEDPKRIILILFGDAYDATPMSDKHPGGLRALMNNNGRECGETFMRIHGPRAKTWVQEFYMGPVEGAARVPSPLRAKVGAEKESVSTQPSIPKSKSTRILKMEPVNSTATIQYFTFSCLQPFHVIPGGHVKLYSNLCEDENRFYTPFKTEVTSFTICMKRYPNGRTSKHFFDCKEGDEVFFDGPFPPSWELSTDAAVQRAAPEERHVVLIAGGTGIAPLYSISVDALETQSSSVTFICSVQTPDDLVLETELRELAARYSKSKPTQRHTFRVILLFSRSSPNDAVVESLSFASHLLYGQRLTAEFLRGIPFSPTQAATICGPPAFDDAVAAAVVKADICTPEQVHCL
ncbi:hypothetical protein JKF63_02858 [Porcisia hertigi]|uniref:Nitrate reductase (NADH) n=1 Tax=Porcisia hertigi TaxID=2761500 RepID=A0A836I5A2_9TRYP|nr:hypothetical protein JKF63_02858 [Porcisia hertigi]